MLRHSPAPPPTDQATRHLFPPLAVHRQPPLRQLFPPQTVLCQPPPRQLFPPDRDIRTIFFTRP